MSRMLQVRNVPDALHRKLKMRAAQEGVSLSDYILAELRRLSERPHRQELLARLAIATRAELTPSPADVVRGERDAR